MILKRSTVAMKQQNLLWEFFWFLHKNIFSTRGKSIPPNVISQLMQWKPLNVIMVSDNKLVNGYPPPPSKLSRIIWLAPKSSLIFSIIKDAQGRWIPSGEKSSSDLLTVTGKLKNEDRCITLIETPQVKTSTYFTILSDQKVYCIDFNLVKVIIKRRVIGKVFSLELTLIFNLRWNVMFLTIMGCYCL